MAWNRYGYVLYNPLKYVDPSGHFNFLPPNQNVMMTDGDQQRGNIIDLSNLGSLERASKYVILAYTPEAPLRFVTPTPLPTPNVYNPRPMPPQFSLSELYTYSSKGLSELVTIWGVLPDDAKFLYSVTQTFQLQGDYSVIFSENGTLININMEIEEASKNGNVFNDDAFLEVQNVVVTLSSGQTISGRTQMYIEGAERPFNIDVFLQGDIQNNIFAWLIKQEYKYNLE